MDEQRGRLLATIKKAFHGVQLGDGVSLHETEVIDCYGTEDERRAARERDEKHDWELLVGDPELCRISGVGGLSFYDATGLRFHLPAYLSLAVLDFEREGASDVMASLMFTLTHPSELNDKRLGILSPAQRECVRDVLVFLRREYDLNGVNLDRAIVDYWGIKPEQ